MSHSSNDDAYYDGPILSQSVMDYVRWKHKAQKSQQFLGIAVIFLLTSTTAIVMFALFMAGVIPRIGLPGPPITISQSDYGTSETGEQVDRYTLANKQGVEIDVLTLGATLSAIRLPRRGQGNSENILVGQDTAQVAYLPLDGVAPNVIRNTADSDDKVFFGVDLHKANWQASQGEDHVTFTHETSVHTGSSDNNTSSVSLNVTFRLTEQSQIIVSYLANNQQVALPMDLTTRHCFNMGPEGTVGLSDHQLQIYSEKYYYREQSSGLLMLAEDSQWHQESTVPVRVPDLSQPSVSEYCLLKGPTGKRLAASVRHDASGRTLRIYTDQPDVHLSVILGKDLNDTDSDPTSSDRIPTGVCLETGYHALDKPQNSADDRILYPGSTYIHTTWYELDSLK